MAILKCKMCGGDLNIAEGVSVCECEYCGNSQTLPKWRDERIVELYDRANHLRRNDDYDKAAAIYEQILSEDNTDAEAYWSLVLCTYGVVYVENPTTHVHTPTVNRVQYTSIFDDSNYQCALQYADPDQREVYAAQAAAINHIQKGILTISQQEAPYDVFICYKEKDAEGNRTPDSVLGQELYYELTELGYKVFFSRITLEGKLGVEYEPYIFAALNSAKVMVVIGTKAEYVNATWVRNEWNRYLSLVKNGEKKMLIPAYKGMDPYDLPVEFSHLQAQNMEKLGFMQDLVRGIEKIVGKKEEQALRSDNPAVEKLLRRIKMFLGDGMFTEAEAYCNKVLDMDPENGMAYVYLLLVQLHCGNIEELYQQTTPLEKMPAYHRAVQYADPVMAERLAAANAAIRKRWEQEQAALKAQMEQARRREEQRWHLRRQNAKRLRWVHLLRWAAIILFARLCATFGPMEDTDDGGFVPFIIILWICLIIPTVFGSHTYKKAVDNPHHSHRMRLHCLWISAVVAGFFGIAATDGDVSSALVAVGSCFWWIAIWFAKYEKEPMVKER